MRQAAQCAGRVIRNKNDYGIVIFADRRYAAARLRSKLPRWIVQFLTSDCMNTDIGTAMAHVRSFLIDMAQHRTIQQSAHDTTFEELEYPP